MFNYNEDLELFWDYNESQFMREECEKYFELKESLKKAKDKEQLDELDEQFKQLILSKVDKEQITNCHTKWSHIFGLPIGIIKPSKFPKAALEMVEEMYECTDGITNTCPKLVLDILSVNI